MGYLPIFLYLASFIFLFVLVINNSLKSKKSRYYQSLDTLIDRLKSLEKKAPANQTALENKDLEEIEQYYYALKSTADPDLLNRLNGTIKPDLARAKMQLYWYNNLVRQRPYSFVAKIMGHHPI